jgi:rhodanese-related sulfurtransferase
LVAACALFDASAAGPSNELAPREAYQRVQQQQALVVDVRTAREFATRHVQGAVNFPLERLGSQATDLAQMTSDRDIILYCRSGRRAQLAEQLLRQHGFSRIWHLRGQLAGWAASGLPTEQGQ